jgi:hypothetical protein
MSLEKPKRIENRKLLNEIKLQTCRACGRPGPNDPHHIRTVKSGGPDTEWNVISLDRRCHTMLHSLGYKQFFAKFPILEFYLKTLGWFWLEDKFWNDKLRSTEPSS